MENKEKKVKTTKLKMGIALATILLIVVLGISANNVFKGQNAKKEESQKINESKVSTIQNDEFDYGTEKGKVIVKYVDTEGNEISSSETQEGIIGKEYITIRRNIDKYFPASQATIEKLNKKGYSDGEPINKTGMYKKEPTEVVYVYEKIDDNITATAENNDVTVQFKNYRLSKDWGLRVNVNSESGYKLSGAGIKLKEENQDVINEGKTVNGTYLVGSITAKTQGTVKYILEEYEAPKGYSLKNDTPIEITITKTWSEEKNAFTIDVSYNEPIEGINVELKEVDDDNETTNEIVVTIENEKISTKDLALKKFVSQVGDNQVNERIVTANVDQEGNVTYNKVTDPLEVNDGKIVKYTFRIYNEGNTATNGRVIVDTIPAGLEFLNTDDTNRNNNWIMYKNQEDQLVQTDDPSEATVIKTDALVSQTIDGFDVENGETPKYKEVYAIFKVNDEKLIEESKIVENIANLENLEEENSENDTDKEKITVINSDYSDLKMVKLATKVNNEATNQDVSISVDEERTCTYNKQSEQVQAYDREEVEFTLRLYNEGNIATNGRTIIEDIPAGLIYLNENDTNIQNGWKMYKADGEQTDNVEEATQIKTDKLVEEQIEGYTLGVDSAPKYKEVKVIFKATGKNLSDDKIVTNTARVEADSSNDKDDPSNDSDQEKIIVSKRPKISMVKVVSKVDEQEVQRNVEVNVDETTGKVTYTKPEEPVEVIDRQKVEFTFKMYNEADKSAYGKEIIDEIPAGLVYLSEDPINSMYEWKMYKADGTETENVEEAVKVKTSYGTKQQIEGYNEYNGETPKNIEIKLVFKVTGKTLPENKIIENVGKLVSNPEDSENPNNPDDPTENPSEKLKVIPTSKISVEKIVSKIDEETVSRNVEVSVNEETGKVTYTKPEEPVKVKDRQIVEFTIRMYNEGTKKSFGKSIADIIPNGLVYLPENDTNRNYEWKMYKKAEDGSLEEVSQVSEATIIKTDYGTKQEIDPYNEYAGETPKYVDIKVVFKVSRKTLQDTKTIKNVLKVLENPEDPIQPVNPEDPTEELEVVPTSKMTVQKIVSTVDNQPVERNIDISVNEETGEVTYTKPEDPVKVKDKQTVEFIIKMYNEGDKTSEGKVIIDEIPNGLVFLQDDTTNKEYGWTMYKKNPNGKLVSTTDPSEATAIKTDYAVKHQINGYDEYLGQKPNCLDIKVVFKVAGDKVSEGEIIKNIAKVEDPDNPDSDEDTSEELVVEYTSDLSIKKFTSKIDEESTEREVIGTINELSEAVYEKNTEMLEVLTGQEVEYTFRVFNEGKKSVSGRQVIDEIPEGLLFLPENSVNSEFNWKMYKIDEEGNEEETENPEEAKLIKSDYLTSQTIEGFEDKNLKYKDLKAVFKVTKTADAEDKTITNIVKTTDDKDNPNDDPTNNTDKETIIVHEEESVTDLSIEKFVSKVDEEDVSRNVKVYVNDEGNIVHEKDDEAVQVANKQKVTFTFRVYNEGTLDTLGREIIDYIPTGLTYLPNDETNLQFGWKMYKNNSDGNLVEVTSQNEAIVLKTDYLTTQNIEKFEKSVQSEPNYKEVKLVMEVDESKVGGNRIIMNTGRLEDDEKDKNKDNDFKEEKLYVRRFDLKVTKYVSKVVLKDNENERSKTFGKDNKGNIVKAEVNSKKINNTQAYITYTIVVENVGDIPGYADEITEIIPKDFQVEEANSEEFKQVGDVLKIRKLQNRLINPGESQEFEVTFRWNLSDDSVGTRTNEAYISEYRNEYNQADITPDNSDKEDIIISIKTGAIIIYTSIIVLTVIVLVVAIIKIRKKNDK